MDERLELSQTQTVASGDTSRELSHVVEDRMGARCLECPAWRVVGVGEGSHPGRAGCLDSHGGVLDDSALLRGMVHAARGQEEEVWSRLAFRHLGGREDLALEELEEPRSP